MFKIIQKYDMIIEKVTDRIEAFVPEPYSTANREYVAAEMSTHWMKHCKNGTGKGDKIMNHTEVTEQEKREGSSYRSPVREIFDKLASDKDVKLVYGEPISYENQCIVPVAKMRYSFGMGGGSGTNADDESSQGQGEGGGGLFSVKPLGVYKMTADRVQFKPAIDLKFIVAVVSALTFGVTLLLRKK